MKHKKFYKQGIRYFFDRLFCKFGFHELKPFDFVGWRKANRRYEKSEYEIMRWICQKCEYFHDIYKPSKMDIQKWNEVANWPEDAAVYIEKIK